MRDDLGRGNTPARSHAIVGLSAPARSHATVGLSASGDESIVILPRVALRHARGAHLRLPRPRLRVTNPSFALASLGALVVGCVAVTVFAAAGPTILVPSSAYAFPSWAAGPLGHLFGHLVSSPLALDYGFSALILAMTAAYAVALASVRLLSMRTIVIVVVALHAVLLLSPPLQLSDLFNYLGYARLGALHHLNPYTHVIAAESHDPIYGLTSWHDLRSPYGPAFTLLTYPVGLLPLPVAYWVLKVVTVLASLGFIALVWRCARRLGHDPRFAVLFVAANPIFLIYELGGFHNDVFMLLPAIASISLFLDGRDRSSGAALMLAVAVKFTMVLLLPFLLLAARPPQRRNRILIGAAVGAVPLLAASLATFGLALPNLSTQSTLLTPFSVPNLVGLMLGLGGGTPNLLRIAGLVPVVVLATMVIMVRRGHPDWISAAGIVTMATLACLAWLTPWYIAWVLPLAALGSSVGLRRVALASTVFLVLAFVPATDIVLGRLSLNPMNTTVGRAVNAEAMRLAE